MPKVSVVIPTFNSRHFIESCLHSAFSQDYSDFEVVVVDNGSNDGTPDLVKNNYPGVILIENGKNLGACKARNQGIEASSGEWVLILDCDVTLCKNFFERIMTFVENYDLRIGSFQPKILDENRRTIYSCGIYLSPLRRFFDIGRGKFGNGRFNFPKYVFGACSAAAIYRRKMLQDIKEDTGYFDERFFFLVEDVDLAWRAQRKGWKALLCPEAICYHLGNSSGFDKRFRQFLCFRNRYYSIIKNEGLRAYVRRVFPLLYYDLPRTMFLLLTNPYMRNEIKNKMS